MSAGTQGTAGPLLTPDEHFEQLVEQHTPDGPVLTEHAVDRWVERVCCRHDGIAPWDLPATFDDSLSVGLPNVDESARLHAPTSALLVYTRDYPGGPAVIVTVLTTDMRITVTDDHLKTCADCGLRYRDDGDDECGWCPEAAERREWEGFDGH